MGSVWSSSAYGGVLCVMGGRVVHCDASTMECTGYRNTAESDQDGRAMQWVGGQLFSESRS